MTFLVELDVALSTLVGLLTPYNLTVLVIFTLVGLVLGAVPGVGGITGLVLLLPFITRMPPEGAVIAMVSIAAVVVTGDSIPAILFGVPGTIGAQATILDGFAMAKNGEAERAFGATFMANLMGGIIGAVALVLSLPILRPLVSAIGSPEMFMVAFLGLAMMGVLTGRRPLIGLALGLLGVMISLVGQDPVTGLFRWTYGQLYLLTGIPIPAAVLGLFAIPEVMDLLASGGSVATKGAPIGGRGVLRGVQDALRHWFLVLRCSVLGTFLGAIPGLGSNVIDWVVYGHAKQTSRNAETFGQGDVRGVIAPESAVNAKVGGSLIPTIAFGVPGSLTMVLLIGGLMMHGIRPGPDMLTTHLPVTLMIVYALVLANVLGTALCMLLAKYMAHLSFMRFQVLVPFITVTIFIAALQSSAHIGDLIVVALFGLIGWLFKRLDWPRPPLALGLVMGPIVNQYLFISIQISGARWLLRPSVIFIGVLIVLVIVSTFLTGQGRKKRPQQEGTAA